MTVSITLNKITKVGSKVYLDFGKMQMEFNDLAHLKQWAAERLDRQTLAALFIKIAIERQPTLANPNQLEGRTLTINTDLNNFGTVG